MMRAKGISDSKFSRANDRRRLGFVESQGGGTILLARGDLAVKMGLPVLAVVAYAQSFGDGVHTSIPAPGLGALGAGRGGKESQLARSLAKLGVGADDIAVISKHDTSTLANDPERDRAARAARRLAGPLRRGTAVRGVAEEPDRARQGRRRGVPDDGPVPDAARRRHPAQPQPGLRRRRAGRRRALRVAAGDAAAGRASSR